MNPIKKDESSIDDAIDALEKETKKTKTFYRVCFGTLAVLGLMLLGAWFYIQMHP